MKAGDLTIEHYGRYVSVELDDNRKVCDRLVRIYVRPKRGEGNVLFSVEDFEPELWLGFETISHRDVFFNDHHTQGMFKVSPDAYATLRRSE